MKKTATTVLLILLAMQARAKDGKGTIQVEGGVGWRPAIDLVIKWTTYYNDWGVYPGWKDYRRFKPVFALGATYNFTKHFAGGIALTQHSYESAWYDRRAEMKVSTYFDAVTICLNAKHDILIARGFVFYCDYCAGVIIGKGRTTNQYVSSNRTDIVYRGTSVLPAIYISPFAVRFGNKIGGYLQAGLGTKGLLSGGVSVKL